MKKKEVTVYNPDDILKLKSNKSLTSLKIYSRSLNDTFLAALAELTGLSSLVLTGDISITNKGLLYLKKLKKLTSLKIEGLNLELTGGFRNIGTLRNLKKLDLTYCELKKKEYQHIQHLTKLEDLDLTLCEPFGDTELAVLAGSLKNLKKLSLYSTAVTPKGTKHLSNFKKLEWLNLREVEFDLSHLKELKNLTFLDLTECYIDASELKHLKDLKKLKKISLDYGNFRVSDLVFAIKKGFPALEDISLYEARYNEEDYEDDDDEY